MLVDEKGVYVRLFKNSKEDHPGTNLGQSWQDPNFDALREKLHGELDSRPPAIGVIGVSGTGKSSLINAMFRTQLPISHTRACTTHFLATELDVRPKGDAYEDRPTRLVVVDAPGLGEDVRKDNEYLSDYHRTLPDCDVIVWLMAARNRGISLDQQYLENLAEFQDRMVFAVNQVDMVHPMDWNYKINLPSEQMESAITDIVADRTERIAAVIGRTPKVTAVSARAGYNLEQLFSTLIDSAPQKRRFIFGMLKNFSYTDFIPPAVRQSLSNIKP